MLLASDNLDQIQSVKIFLHGTFKIKNLGEVKYFLGLEILRSSACINVCQHKYFLDLLRDTGFLGCKPTSTPMVPSTKLTKQDGPHLQDAFLYRQLIGKLLYLTNTRPDICYSVQQFSQFLDAPTQTHLQAAHQILRYLLKGILGQGIFYAAKNSLHLKTFSDSD